MKALIAVACLCGVVSLGSLGIWATAPATPAPAPAPPPGVYFLDPEQHLGTVGLNEHVRGSFTVVNNTARPVTFAEPLKSCACTAAELERRELAPGERCALGFTIQTGSHRVPRAETVTLLYTTPDEPAPRQLFGRVTFVPKGVFEVEPATVTLTREKPKASFVVRGNPATERNKVLRVLSNHRCVKVDASALPTVTLELDLGTPDESILNVECTVYTDNPAEAEITIPVRVHKD